MDSKSKRTKRRVLSNDEVRDIRQSYRQNRRLTMAKLADQYQVSEATISAAINRKGAYTHVRA